METPGHEQEVRWIITNLKESGWEVELQMGEMMGNPVQNVIAYRQQDGDHILLGAHYDTRLYADQDPDPELRKEPVPGANDGASGVAVLLELARVLPKEMDIPVRLVFFDAEDNGDIPGWDWILGSRMYVEKMETHPRIVLILDMIGDADLNLYYEKTSQREIQEEIWTLGRELGYEEYFIPSPKYAVIDDHTPFLNQGIPAVNIIDFDYPYWHTTSDTLDKVSPESLEVVGETVLQWLMGQTEAVEE
ncbi:MAG: M28 family peptidase [Anaerolineales bacterium]|nr:M28 family peptidase [Anaerolineales bacterium]